MWVLYWASLGIGNSNLTPIHRQAQELDVSIHRNQHLAWSESVCLCNERVLSFITILQLVSSWIWWPWSKLALLEKFRIQLTRTSIHSAIPWTDLKRRTSKVSQWAQEGRFLHQTNNKGPNQGTQGRPCSTTSEPRINCDYETTQTTRVFLFQRKNNKRFWSPVPGWEKMMVQPSLQ